ncbi:MAG TPA: hypothetical protein VJC15_02655 [Candidatus Paceibacterota bacterium]
MLTILVLIVLGFAYVGLMNWLGGEKYLFGNRIRETIQDIKKLRS